MWAIPVICTSTILIFYVLRLHLLFESYSKQIIVRKPLDSKIIFAALHFLEDYKSNKKRKSIEHYVSVMAKSHHRNTAFLLFKSKSQYPTLIVNAANPISPNILRKAIGIWSTYTPDSQLYKEGVSLKIDSDMYHLISRKDYINNQFYELFLLSNIDRAIQAEYISSVIILALLLLVVSSLIILSILSLTFSINVVKRSIEEDDCHTSWYWCEEVNDLFESIKTFKKLQHSWRHDLLSAVLATHNMFEQMDDLGRVPLSDPDREADYQIAKERAAFAYRMVRDTRKLGQISKLIKPQRMSVTELFASIQTVFTSNNIEYKKPNKEYYLNIDSSYFIGRAMSNVIENSIKYSGGINERITVGFSLSKDGKGVISVKDQGIGMSEECQKKILAGHWGIDVRENSDIPGTGLGLNSAIEIFRAHGGEVIIKSELGKGTLIAIKLTLVV